MEKEIANKERMKKYFEIITKQFRLDLQLFVDCERSNKNDTKKMKLISSLYNFHKALGEEVGSLIVNTDGSFEMELKSRKRKAAAVSVSGLCSLILFNKLL
jgi:hypothetical protein